MIERRLDIDPVVLSSIFSNLIDNAMKAVQTMPDSERIITVKAALNGDYLTVKVENPAEQKYVRDEGRKHYGHLIMQDLADRYHGNWNTTYQKHMYLATTSIMEGQDEGSNL